MLRHRPYPSPGLPLQLCFRAPEDSSAMSTARVEPEGGFASTEQNWGLSNPQNQAEGIPSAPECPQEGVTQPSGWDAPGWVFLLNLQKLRSNPVFHVCSLADSMNSLRGEWYQKWQTGEPVAPRGAGQWRGFQTM